MNKKNFSIFCYIIALLTLLGYIDCIFTISYIPETGRLIFLIISCIFLYIGGLLLSKYKKNNKPMKINLWIFFVLYIILFLTLTLFDSSWGRNGFIVIKWSNKLFKNYIKNNLNLIPFSTIISYLKRLNGLYPTSSLVYNLLGNFVACMPFSLFLPLLFKKQNKFKNYLVTIAIIVLSIELTQFLTLSGRCDIDDFILNVSGAVILYLIIKIKAVNNLIRNIFLLEKNEVSLKSIFIVTIIIFLVVSINIVFIAYRDNKYKSIIKEHNKEKSPTITFRYDRSLNYNCSKKDLFYEDSLYNYYLKCYAEKGFYVIVNNNEKLKIKNLINSKKYNVDIYRILDEMKFYNIGYSMEHKYVYDRVTFTIDNYEYKLNTTIENKEIVNIILKCVKKDTANISYDVNIIPKQEGTTTMKLNMLLYDESNNEISNITKNIKIEVDKDLDVTYSELD